MYKHRFSPTAGYTASAIIQAISNYEYEVEADTFAKATEIAENMASDLLADITYIEVYKAA